MRLANDLLWRNVERLRIMCEHLPSNAGPIHLAMATLSALNMVGLRPLAWMCLNESEVCVNRHEPVLNATVETRSRPSLASNFSAFCLSLGSGRFLELFSPHGERLIANIVEEMSVVVLASATRSMSSLPAKRLPRLLFCSASGDVGLYLAPGDVVMAKRKVIPGELAP